MDLKIFATRLKELRLEKSLTQFQLAVRVNCVPSAIGLWENGKRMPSADSIYKLAKFFNVSAGYLIGLED